jgi:hypothetical protein
MFANFKAFACTALTLFAGHALVADHAAAQPRYHLLVVAEDADRDTVPRDNRIFNEVFQALSEELNTRGFTMIDERAAGMNITSTTRVRRTDTELIDIARALNRPLVDAVVIFQIYASAKRSGNSDIMRPDIRIPGRIINVRTNTLMGSFDVSGLDLPALPANCDRECVLEQMGRHARTLARDLGAALSVKLAALGDGRSIATEGGRPVPSSRCGGMPAAFTLVFDGFGPSEITRMEEYFTAFSDFCATRPVRTSGTYAEYWYETQADAARLNRNLRLMLEQMGVNGQINLTGNTIKVVKVATR